MFASDQSGISVSVDTFPATFVQLLAVRAVASINPRPDLPPLLGQEFLEGRVHLDEVSVTAWQQHWAGHLRWLQRPDRVQHPFEHPAWPAQLPMIDENAYAHWRRELPNVKRGTPLEDRPSRRYWRERTADQDLPEQLIVLPLEGMWSERISDRTALVSSDLYFGDRSAAALSAA